jgi:hypothetical protein
VSKVTILSSRARPGLAYYEDIYFKYELADQVRHDKIDFCNTSIINSNMKHQITILLVFSLLFPSFLQAKKDREQIDRGIHSSTFIPKGQWMVGGSFSYSESNSDDYKFLILKNVEGKRYSFSVSPNFGYFIRDNVAVGGRFSYTRDYIDIGNLDIDLNEDLSFKINNASLLQHMIYGTGFVRTYINLGNSKRFGLFNEARVTFGAGQGKTYSGEAETLDGVYEKIKHLQVGIAPGMTAFITNNAAVEVSVGVMGFDSKWIEQDHNKVIQGSRRETSAKFKIDLFSINLGMTYYF